MTLPSTPDGAARQASALIPTGEERERVVGTLTAAFADDRISLEEFERRTVVVYRAQTVAELRSVVADLSLTSESETVPAHGRIVTVFSNHERGGRTTVPRRLEIVSVFGNVELDLTDAIFARGITEIDVSAVFGNVELTLPPGVKIESTGSGMLGSFEVQLGGGYAALGGDTSQTVIRISGHAVLANVEATVSYAKLGVGNEPRRLT